MKPVKAVDQITEPLPVNRPITAEDVQHLERLIRDLADRKYVCPFNDRLVLLMEHDAKHETQLRTLIHDVNGNEVPGIKDNMRILLEERANRSKLNWLIVGAVVGNFLVTLFK
jgi:hypothetical protein